MNHWLEIDVLQLQREQQQGNSQVESAGHQHLNTDRNYYTNTSFEYCSEDHEDFVEDNHDGTLISIYDLGAGTSFSIERFVLRICERNPILEHYALDCQK